jgi:hypothetical protein
MKAIVWILRLTMKRLITIGPVLLLFVLSVSQPAAARLTRGWTDQEVFNKADFVVIPTALSSKDTKERATLPDIQPDNHVIGVETEFQTLAVLKGPTDIAKFRFHHYRSTEDFTNGPMLVEIPAGKHHTYLLFLIKERDGRYAPATDQTDPAEWSVLQLRGATGPRMGAPDPAVRVDQINASPSVVARSGKGWTYREMFEKSGVVVIGEWSGTKETDERSTLPETAPAVRVVGVTTEFKVSLVLKGSKDVKEIGLHHYKFQYEDDALRDLAPQLIRILEPVHREGVDYPGGGRFLLFLSKETDGRYTPVTGQTNPAVYSVLNLREAVD